MLNQKKYITMKELNKWKRAMDKDEMPLKENKLTWSEFFGYWSVLILAFIAIAALPIGLAKESWTSFFEILVMGIVITVIPSIPVIMNICSSDYESKSKVKYKLEENYQSLMFKLNETIITDWGEISRLYQHLDIKKSTSKELAFDLNEGDYTTPLDILSRDYIRDKSERNLISEYSNEIAWLSYEQVVELYDFLQQQTDYREARGEAPETYQKYKLYKPKVSH